MSVLSIVLTRQSKNTGIISVPGDRDHRVAAVLDTDQALQPLS